METKTLVPIAILLGLLAAFILVLKPNNQNYVVQQPQILIKDKIEIKPETPISPNDKIENPILSLIKQINERNKNLFSLSCEDLDVNLGDVPIKLVGRMAYEKPRNFRLTVYSRFKKEADIGSNNQLFWLWTSRIDPPALHYANYEDLDRTRLKLALNPNGLIEALGLDQTNIEDLELGYYGKNYGIIQNRPVMGRKLKVLTLIDPESKTVKGRYLYDGNKVLVSSENLSYNWIDGIAIPKLIKIVWHEENKNMQLSINFPKINLGIDPRAWTMPKMDKTINMGKQ